MPVPLPSHQSHPSGMASCSNTFNRSQCSTGECGAGSQQTMVQWLLQRSASLHKAQTHPLFSDFLKCLKLTVPSILKPVPAREKQQITHKGIPIRITADLSIETLQTRREWQDILRVMKENNLQPRLLYPARISFRYEELRSFTDKQKLREFSTTKPALQQMLKDLL